jgi:hypothetical protein
VPFVAVSVARFPATPPEVETDGVVSLVTLSVSDAPVSDDASRSGVVGADGAAVSIVSSRAGLATLELPAASVSVALTDQTSGLSVGIVHEVALPTTYEHDAVDKPFDAVSFIVSPEIPPDADNVGVKSLVRLSVSDAPVSDDASKSGVVGADGTDDGMGAAAGASMIMPKELLAKDVFPAGSVSVALTDHEPAANVGKSHEVLVPIV